MKIWTWIPFILYIGYHQITARWIENTGETYYKNRQEENKTNPKVYDIAHKYIPDLRKYQVYNHIFTFALLIPLLKNVSVLEEYVSYWVPLFFVRSIFNIVTILPKNKCCCVDNTKQFAFVGGCYDKVFSGHFASVLLSMLLYHKYKWIPMSTSVALLSLNGLGILLTRSHYTIDLLVAFVTTMFMYQNNVKL